LNFFYINLVEVREIKTNILEQRMHLPDYQVMSTTRYLRNVSAYPVLFVTHTIMIEKLYAFYASKIPFREFPSR
jgi:hypothetical protein